MCAVLVWISITNSTYTRWSSTVSTCKSQARIPDAWVVRNCRQVGDVRRGAGPSLAAARIRRIVGVTAGQERQPAEHADREQVDEADEHERRA
jgi:hypothetical protein